MKEKLRLLMENEQLRSGQLAERLEINPAAISHLLSGRNKPGFDLLQRILRRFPRISPDWLLLDQGPMYRTSVPPAVPTAATTSSATPPSRTAGDLFDSIPAATPSSPDELPAGAVPDAATDTASRPGEQKTGSAKVARIVVLYDNGTFEDYAPSVR